ncbi:hypothetical protein HYPDE_37283 [Hyphomicrobium denitrificans 1NES1]|uniref:Uncharacterized protein n=1 Tax=Hyphomicrobium denitrificans 1NES1 TaxID=670307 RepID=N0B7Y6_9HYPH|nr:hypothetical protein HYPDE_37283 [Hyphomicrobium denitrificans 1NES1]
MMSDPLAFKMLETFIDNPFLEVLVAQWSGRPPLIDVRSGLGVLLAFLEIPPAYATRGKAPKLDAKCAKTEPSQRRLGLSERPRAILV